MWIPGTRKGQLSDQYLLVGRTGTVELSLQGAFVAVIYVAQKINGASQKTISGRPGSRAGDECEMHIPVSASGFSQSGTHQEASF